MFKWVVVDVVPNSDFTLLITFAKGHKKIFDCKTLFNDPYAEPLKNLDFFLQAKADHNTVMWSEDFDISPEFLYEHSKKI